VFYKEVELSRDAIFGTSCEAIRSKPKVQGNTKQIHKKRR